MADYWHVTMNFQPKHFELIYEYITLQRAVKTSNVKTSMFKIPLGFSAFTIYTDDPDINCIAFEEVDEEIDFPLPLSIQEYYYVKEPKSIYFLEAPFNCIPKYAYDVIFDEFKLYSLNVLFEIVFYVAIAVFCVLFLLLWWCCYGFCECKCCGIFVMCCDKDDQMQYKPQMTA